MTKKLSIVRFKPKPEHFDEFIAAIKERNNGDTAMTEFKLMKTATEVVAIGVRDPSVFDESVQSGVEWLDQHRHMLQEYDPINRHTIPMTGGLVEQDFNYGDNKMIKAKVVLTAWDRTLETRDFSHLSVFLSDDFQFEDTIGEIGDLANTESWCVAGEIRISNFNTIRENDHYIVATHDVEQDGKPHSNVMVYAEQTNGKFTYWKIQRAFEVQVILSE